MRRRIIPTATRLKSHDKFDDYVIAWPNMKYNARVQKATGTVTIFTFKRWEKVGLVRFGQLIDGVKAALFNLKTDEARATAELPTSIPYGVATGEDRSTFKTHRQELVEQRPSFVEHMAALGQPVTPVDPAGYAALGEPADALPPLKEGERRLVGVIDATPRWRDLLPGLLAALVDGSPKGQGIARAELERMALAADAYVAISKKGVE